MHLNRQRFYPPGQWPAEVRHIEYVLAAVAVAGVGLSAYEAVAASGGAKKAPALPSDQGAKAAAAAESAELARRRGMASTILTGPEGIGTSPTTLKAKLGD